MEHLSEADLAETNHRAAIIRLYREEGITPARGHDIFRCVSNGSCCPAKNYYNGTWPYIGDLYGSRQPRVLFIAMERGAGYSLEEEKTLADTQGNFRRNCENPVNPHMGGVSQMIGQITRDGDKALNSRRFALTNAVKCVKMTGNQTSSSTRTMMRNCRAHLERELVVFAPDLVITQGGHPAETLLAIDNWQLRAEFSESTSGTRRANIYVCPDRHFILVTTPHPARNSWRWKHGSLPTYIANALSTVKDLS